MNNSGHTILIRGGITTERRTVPYVTQTLPTIRKWFDGELVISTWKGQEVYLEGLESYFDKLILTDDPGDGFTQAYNRQLISYEKGFAECSGELILSARADMNFETDIFPFWHKMQDRIRNHMRVFENRVLVGNMMTISPEKAEPKESFFRVSDWFHLGAKKDIGKLSGVLEKSKELYSRATGLVDLSCNSYKNEHGTEQIWFISLLNAFVDPTLDLTNYQDRTLECAWNALINNFGVLNTISTLRAKNLNWYFQPEFHSQYITEQEFFHMVDKL